jgi:glycolate oxidase
MNFGKINDLFVSRLENAIGSGNVFAEVYDTLPYARDNCICRWSKKFASRPDVAVTPESTEQVAAIIKIAAENRIPVTPRGGGTGMTGGCVPKYGGISLDMKKMNKITEVDSENLFVRVQPGITNLELSRQLAEKGFLGPHDPGSAPSSCIGGQD